MNTHEHTCAHTYKHTLHRKWKEVKEGREGKKKAGCLSFPGLMSWTFWSAKWTLLLMVTISTCPSCLSCLLWTSQAEGSRDTEKSGLHRALDSGRGTSYLDANQQTLCSSQNPSLPSTNQRMTWGDNTVLGTGGSSRST